METFTEPKELVENTHYQDQKQKSLTGIADSKIDDPIIELINGFNNLPYCFTLQSCYGHFIYNGQNDPHNLESLSLTDTIDRVEYRIAYIAFCVENSVSGRGLLAALNGITDIDPENIQFCCAEWFWKRQVNSYALQVEPDRFKLQDRATLEYKEALNIEKRRNSFFYRLDELLKKERERQYAI